MQLKAFIALCLKPKLISFNLLLLLVLIKPNRNGSQLGRSETIMKDTAGTYKQINPNIELL